MFLKLRQSMYDIISIGVEISAHQTYQHWYNLISDSDAMSTVSDEEHTSIVNFIFPEIYLVISTEKVLENA